IGIVLAVAACKGKKADPNAAIQTTPVARQDIVVDVEATGVIQPINAVQVKSKASGQVMHLHVSTGSEVKPNDLLVEIDPRDAKSRYDQAVAALQAAQANVTVTKAQLARSQSLAKEGVITAPEVETAILASAKATSDLVAAQAALDQAKIALEDVTIRAPMAGTVIEKDVSEGQVISSATNTVGGGTTLLTMADLGQVYDSTLVSESDIGNVKAGQTASVKVDAYPNRTFTGSVEKIAPQATVQQSVTMFPVLIRLDNRDGALMPGMNTDVSILVEHADNVLAIPNDAVRSMRDAATAATALGLDPAKVRESLASQRGGGAGGGGRGGAAGGAPAVTVSQSQCDSVQKVLASHPASQAALTKLRQQMRTDTAHAAQLRASMKATTDSLHLDQGVLRGCMQLRRTSAGGAALAMGDGSETPTPGNTRPHAGLVFVAANGTFEPRLAMLGVGNYDVTQVLSGLNEGDNVALINAAMLQQQRAQQQQKIQSRMGLPGVNQGSGAAAGGGRAGGAGGGGGGGGRGAGGGAAGGASGGGAPAAGGARPTPPAGPPPP
ncbi:MAG TPA: efflux RND transporter periplasmic adaptor subunit, partial [Gemmatimonadaceae bacterium]|nr:efflux RND transporter periplasmic adaptor subunit [Gemmatimonadaceae bacterium]